MNDGRRPQPPPVGPAERKRPLSRTLIKSDGWLFALLLAAVAAWAVASSGTFRRGFYFLEVALNADQPGLLQVYWDTGRGLNESDSSTAAVPAGISSSAHRLPLRPGSLAALRLDPAGDIRSGTMGTVRVIAADGRVMAQFRPEAWIPHHEIARYESAGQAGWRFEMTPGATDPSLLLTLEVPLALPFGIGQWAPPAALTFLVTLLGVGAIGGLRLGRAGLTLFGQAAAWTKRYPWPALMACTLAIWLGTLISWPMPTTEYLDASWQQALVHARLHGLQFPRDLIFTAGPWGFLFSHFYLEAGLGLKIVWEIAGKLILAGVLVAATTGLPGRRRALFLVAVALLGGLVLDTWLILLVSLLVLNVLLRPERGRLALAGALAVLTFLALVKFTLFVLGAAGTAVAVGAAIASRDLRRALVLGGGYGLGLLTWWLAAGQNPVRLHRFVGLSWEISEGYPWAMAVPAPEGALLLALLVLGALGLYLWTQFRAAESLPGGRIVVWPIVLVAAGTLFVAWKHGFTRADGHMLIFFFIALLLALLLPGLITPRRRMHGVEFTALLCLLGAWFADDTIVIRSPELFIGRMRDSAPHVIKPGQFVANWRNWTAQERDRLAMPWVREKVGDASIDYVTHEQGRLMIQGLNYRPRPVLQSYSAYTPDLLSRNLGWVQRNDRAARFLLIDLQTIDNRLLAQDDSLMLADLPRRYRRVEFRAPFLLLERRNEQPPADGLRRDLIREETIQFGQEVALPEDPPAALWLKVPAEANGLGRARALLYKPPLLWIVTTDTQGVQRRQRLVPSMAAEGFIIQPFIADTAAYNALFDGAGAGRLRSFRIEAEGDEAEFWRALRYELSTVPHLPLISIPPEDRMVLTGASNVRPRSVSSPIGVELQLEDGRAAVLVHSPGALELPLEPGQSRLRGWFGLRPGAYQIGATDGAEFSAELVEADGTRRPLWRRLLQPGTAAADRSAQPVDLTWSATPPGSRLVLRTLPGPRDDTSWDWTYWAELRLE